LLKGDAFRSLAFITVVFIVLYFDLRNKVAPVLVYGFLIFFITVDLVVVDKRYFSTDNYKRKREAVFMPTAAEKQILSDKDLFRVWHSTQDGRGSYFFNSIDGYHGAILKRYENLQDSCIYNDLQKLGSDYSAQTLDFSRYGILNMLTCKYLIVGDQPNQFIVNQGANGPAWFVQNIIAVNSPDEELEKVRGLNTRTTAVIDVTKFKTSQPLYDSTSSIALLEYKPNYLKYEAQTQTNNLTVFSEIYYPEGWIATIDGKETPIVRVNYVLRALEVPAGKHTIEFRFAPKSYTFGNPITQASSWLLLIILVGSLGWSVRNFIRTE
jgi:hypothetical protein